MNILAIESSCDETACAVVSDGRSVLSNIISSQIDIHKLYGGVVPEIASRRHIEKINGCVRAALSKARMTLAEVDALAVTNGPGLVGALLVGVSHAKAMAFATGKPLVPVHHIEGHICANYIESAALTPPFICLVASGGHSHLVLVRDYRRYEILGQTRDDAAGEAFDKVARALGLPYPGGPAIDGAAREGNAEAIAFPQAKIAGAGYDFSFSGLKSAVLNYLNHQEMKQEAVSVPDVAASFQKAVVDVLTEHTLRAAEEYDCGRVAIAGGVASNTALRAALRKGCETAGRQFYCPSPVLCTDNAAMIASAAYFAYQDGVRAPASLNAMPNLAMGERERRFHV